jgi:hypothetical protein
MWYVFPLSSPGAAELVSLLRRVSQVWMMERCCNDAAWWVLAFTVALREKLQVGE